MKDLQVQIDDHSGFCFGVVYAIEMAEEVLDEQGYLYCLGDIVHNDEEVRRLSRKGLKIIDHEELQHLKDEKVLIRAHGEPPSTYELSIKNNLTLIDASCPVVLKLQNRIKHSFDKADNIYIYGTKPGRRKYTVTISKNLKDRFAQTLGENPRTTVRIVGHTDSTGNDTINEPLSVNRAAAVRNYLTARGVAPNRVAIDGRGSREPIASNATEAGRAQNRRVDIFVAEPPAG